MGARNSTRAITARSVKRSPKLRRKSAAHNHVIGVVSQGSAHASQPVDVLSDISLRLRVAMAATVVCGAALKPQNADSDEDAAVVLQRCVADKLDRQIERLDILAARCREGKS
jgi:hypothetical protein